MITITFNNAWNRLENDLGHMFSRSVSGSSIRNEWASRKLLLGMQRNLRFGSPGTVTAKNRYFRSGKHALRDTDELLNSLHATHSQTDAVAGTQHVRGVHDSEVARTITTGKNRGYLAIPLSPPLTEDQARLYNNHRIPGGVVLYDGPDGPGVYVKAFSRTVKLTNNRRRISTVRGVGSIKVFGRVFGQIKNQKYQVNRKGKYKPGGGSFIPGLGGGPSIAKSQSTKYRMGKQDYIGTRKWKSANSLVMAKAFVKSVKMKPRSFAKPHPDWIQDIRDGFLEHIVTGKLPK